MAATQLAVPLDELLGAYFLTREAHGKGTLFLAPDPECCGHCHRLLIRSEAWRRRHEQEMSRATAQAIKLLKRRGGDLVILETQTGELVVRRGPVGVADEAAG